MPITIPLHILAVVIWVGGMFFAYMALRPVAAQQLEAPARLRLWRSVFQRFFPWVWISVLVILVTGYWMLFIPYGGMKSAPIFIHVMQTLGLIMMAIFAHVFFAPFKRLGQAVDTMNWADGGKALGQIRLLIAINLVIGVANIVIAGAGKYY